MECRWSTFRFFSLCTSFFPHLKKESKVYNKALSMLDSHLNSHDNRVRSVLSLFFKERRIIKGQQVTLEGDGYVHYDCDN